jgi:hypothetical protein
MLEQGAQCIAHLMLEQGVLCIARLMLEQGVLCIAHLILLLKFMDFFGRTPDYNSYWTLTFKHQT